jgi:hypothetical protein
MNVEARGSSAIERMRPFMSSTGSTPQGLRQLITRAVPFATRLMVGA